MATIEIAKLGFRWTPRPKSSPINSIVRRGRLQFRKAFEPYGNRSRRIVILQPLSCSLVDERKQKELEDNFSFNEKENSLVDALIGIQGRGRSASPQQLQVQLSLSLEFKHICSDVHVKSLHLKDIFGWSENSEKFVMVSSSIFRKSLEYDRKF